MTEQTAEEAKKASIAKMGTALGEQYSALWQEVTLINMRWHEFVELFGTKKTRIDLLNRAAPFFFRTVQDTLWEAILLHLARLTDPPQSAGKSNLTIRNLPNLITDATLKADVTKLVEQALTDTEF